jgi:adenosylhomocysteine nucleosidase
MIGIVIASDLEAAPFLALLNWQKIADQPFPVFRKRVDSANFTAVIVISGMGKVAAAVATHLLLCRYQVTQIFNPGVCGALKDVDGFEPGAVFYVQTAVEGDRKEGPLSVAAERCASKPFSMLPGASLVTCDQPVFDIKRKNSLSALGDLIDMEGAAIARVANMYACPCVLIKGITDRAKEGERSILTENIKAVSQKLAELVIGTLLSPAKIGNVKNE